ncbi:MULTISPECIES: peptide chain release factor 1 [Trueperella]|uniref:Peptide chain release factor 1 n=1 Tax=Trueperella abortisuis TaxID=445930 RepID=A0ABT9PJT8_9ACTO|nr:MULTISPECIES: peptide chain release factor 1 [Trueperella]MCI7304933.1 peptide chain release factor 1 [Trueperella sp.]MDP9832977.1 peptide chain release factor 1 [Trueperella abortisuis]MDY5404374.1 peptide chain release factor 1 [Trueperella sp.]
MSEFPAAQAAAEEYHDIEKQMASAEVLAKPEKLRKLGRRYAELRRVVSRYEHWLSASTDLSEAKEIVELGGDDGELFAAELPRLQSEVDDAAEALRDALLPRDPDDGRDVILEVKAGEGGEESALFASDLLRMYQRYAESKGWATQILSHTDTDMGGYKDVQMAIKAKHVPEDPADGVWAHLKYEAGVHRVQRVPVTESQGRVHTSAAGVLVFAEVDEPEEVQVNENDLRIDVYRSSGPGGQSVNTTDSAVRITHLPTGITVSMQDEKSQIKNREAAMRVLLARLRQAQMEELAAKEADQRRSQVRTVDRSERVRTYNFPENRIADHRTGFKAHNLDQVLAGHLDDVITSLREKDEEERLQAAADEAEAK